MTIYGQNSENTQSQQSSISYAASFGSNDQLAYFLTNDYWGGAGQEHSFDTSISNVITVNLTGLSSAAAKLARAALEAWANVSNITFSEVSSGGKITFQSSDPDGAYSYSSFSGNTIISSTVNIPDNWSDVSSGKIGGYGYQTYLHELGHALGLGHQGNYNGSATYGVDNDFINDSWQASVMSYFSQTDNTSINADFAYLTTAMMADVIAMQNLYGAPGGSSVTGGDTTWGSNTNLTGYLGTLFDAIDSGSTTDVRVNNPLALTIYDQGGTDLINLINSNSNNRLDMNAETYSDIYGLIGNLAIARGTVIENATMGSGNDTVTGNAVGNVIHGMGGSDTLFGMGGDDTLIGGAGVDSLDGGSGNDFLYGDIGNDTLLGGIGNDRLIGGIGADVLNGGTGIDTVRYVSSTAVTVNLGANTGAGGEAQGDTFIGIENVVGSQFNDILIGDSAANKLEGLDGNDLLRGGLGADILIGYAGIDTADYSDSLVGVNIGTYRIGTGGTAQGDQLIYMEKIIGSGLGDVLIGGGQGVTLDGMGGNDLLFDYGGNTTLNGGAGNDFIQGGFGADAIDGGTGIDTISYANTSSVNINLETGFGTGYNAEGDTIVNVENVIGSNAADVIVGDNGDNEIRGLNGADIITGGGGNDMLFGGGHADHFVFDTTTFGRDLILDFQDNWDKIDLRGSGLTFADFTVVDTTQGVRLDYFNGTETVAIHFYGIDPSQLTASDFIV